MKQLLIFLSLFFLNNITINAQEQKQTISEEEFQKQVEENEQQILNKLDDKKFVSEAKDIAQRLKDNLAQEFPNVDANKLAKKVNDILLETLSNLPDYISASAFSLIVDKELGGDLLEQYKKKPNQEAS